jgi:hypothetical protein
MPHQWCADPQASRIVELESEKADLREELDAVLSDWNALVRAIGAPANGTAIGHAAKLKAENERLAQSAKDLREALRRLITYGDGNSFCGPVVVGVRRWFDSGMTGPLPALPAFIVEQESLKR